MCPLSPIMHLRLGDLSMLIHAHRLSFKLLSKDVSLLSRCEARRGCLAQEKTVR